METTIKQEKYSHYKSNHLHALDVCAQMIRYLTVMLMVLNQSALHFLIHAAYLLNLHYATIIFTDVTIVIQEVSVHLNSKPLAVIQILYQAAQMELQLAVFLTLVYVIYLI